MKKKQPSAWRQKLPGIFFEVAQLMQVFERRWAQIQRKREADVKALSANATNASRAGIDQHAIRDVETLHAWVTERLHAINERYPEVPYNKLAYSYLWDGPTEPTHDEQLSRFIHWHRHGESLAKTRAADARGDLSAYQKLARTGEDLRRAVYRKGGFKPFKGDLVHQQFLTLVLCYAHESLTAEELAECADTYCGCGKRDHDADALRKQFARLLKDLRASAPPDALK